jgi:hypothetical protein
MMPTPVRQAEPGPFLRQPAQAPDGLTPAAEEIIEVTDDMIMELSANEIAPLPPRRPPVPPASS